MSAAASILTACPPQRPGPPHNHRRQRLGFEGLGATSRPIMEHLATVEAAPRSLRRTLDMLGATSSGGSRRARGRGPGHDLRAHREPRAGTVAHRAHRALVVGPRRTYHADGGDRNLLQVSREHSFLERVEPPRPRCSARAGIPPRWPPRDPARTATRRVARWPAEVGLLLGHDGRRSARHGGLSTAGLARPPNRRRGAAHLIAVGAAAPGRLALSGGPGHGRGAGLVATWVFYWSTTTPRHPHG